MKRLLLFFSFFIYISGFSQSPSIMVPAFHSSEVKKELGFKSVVKKTIDKITGDTTYSGDPIVINPKSIVAYITTNFTKGDRDIVLSFYANKKIFCVDEGDKIYFLFTDGSRLSLLGHQLYNCKSRFSIRLGETFGSQVGELSLTLQAKKIKSVRLESNETLDFDLTPQQSDLFNKQIIELISVKNSQ